jgi:uncharacterized membrane protein
MKMVKYDYVFDNIICIEAEDGSDPHSAENIDKAMSVVRQRLNDGEISLIFDKIFDDDESINIEVKTKH